ncbi:MAG: sodium:solute symporter [Phycisphaerae bacterium]
MHPLDLSILIAYVGVVLGIGFYVKRRASRGLESYFLGGRTLPWWMIAMSGSSSYFDITGTMWIVSMFVAYGFNGFWIQWMWGFLIAAFYLAFMGKWIRRSGVLTGAEWMVYRFGSGPSGDAARLAYTMFAVLTLTAFIGYTAVGMGKFGSQFLPITEWFPNIPPHYADKICSTLIIGITGAYVVVGGFTGLTIVEFVQTIILTTGAVLIGWLGYLAFEGESVAVALQALASGADRLVHVAPGDWFSIVPPWRIENSENMYAIFGAVVIAFLLKGLLLGASGPEQLYDFQKFLATRNPREASLAGMLWGVCHTVRFPMAMAIAIMGLMAVAKQPDAAFDAEKVLPYVIANHLPWGLKGIALAALIAAFMATFSAMVNGAASYLIRDIYQRYIRPAAAPGHYVKASYVASVLMIMIGIGISFVSDSINVMITWILGFLGSAVLLPNVLRWYWWRLTGYGFAAGMWTGMVLSLAQMFLEPLIADQLGYAVPVYLTLPILAICSTLACVLVTLITEPPDLSTLAHFYRTTQPAGSWGPVVRQVRRETPDFRKEPFAPDLVSLVVALGWLGAMYVGPSYLVAHQWRAAGICGVIVALGSVYLATVWYRQLPAPGETTAEVTPAPALKGIPVASGSDRACT